MLPALDHRGKHNISEHLEDVSILAFGMYSASSASAASTQTFRTEEGWVVELDDEDAAYVVRKPKKGRIRPGMEGQAIRRSANQMNLENSINAARVPDPMKSPPAGICYRCGKSDHLLKNCPLPHTRKLDFAPNRAKPSNTSQTLVAGEEGEVSDIKQEVFGSIDTTSRAAAHPNVSADQMEVPFPEHKNSGQSQLPGNARINDWFDEYGQVFKIMVCESPKPVDIYAGSILNPNNADYPCPQHIGDCGGIAIVMGETWFAKRSEYGEIAQRGDFAPIEKASRF